jgi:hypothetical protein
LATQCGRVIKSYWLEKTKFSPARWAGLGTNEVPVAWQHFVTPEHPFQESDAGVALGYIPLNKGMFAIVDIDDLPALSGSTWFAVDSGKTFYAVRSVLGKFEAMHRVILGLTGEERVDHENRNGLDNRRENLRACNASQNGANADLRADNTSGFKGVTGRNGKWVARISAHGEKIYLGTFSCPYDAADAYDNAAIKHFGEFALLNSMINPRPKTNATSVEPTASELIVHKHQFLDDAGSGA